MIPHDVLALRWYSEGLRFDADYLPVLADMLGDAGFPEKTTEKLRTLPSDLTAAQVGAMLDDSCPKSMLGRIRLLLAKESFAVESGLASVVGLTIDRLPVPISCVWTYAKRKYGLILTWNASRDTAETGDRRTTFKVESARQATIAAVEVLRSTTPEETWTSY